MEHQAAFSLRPRRPPGHRKRRALAYAQDILRLRGEGHTYDAIREALQDAGVVVSISTVRREVLRGDARPASWAPVPAEPPIQRLAGAQPALPQAAPNPLPTTLLQGRAVAEAFMRSRPTNHLFAKEPVK